ncbi:MAG: Putative nicotinate phosphoribosyltransferase [Candidatus Methanolliviera sp. GoM_oil]|nr:MAG: Putative nicotinate phosphoribosyltransferase [Candidatus Methanolliviera sp. GoM_oil]
MRDNIFMIVSDEDIKSGMATDVYFLRTEEILKKKGINPQVVAEVTASSLDGWGVLCGLEDVSKLLEGLPIDVYAMEEGCVFYEREPVLRIEGKYLDFARYETSILGFLCQESGIAAKAAKIKYAAQDKNVISFGTRRQHPALAAVVERSAMIGGMDGISNVAGGKMIGIVPAGTIPHALIIAMRDQREAWKAFDELMPADVMRTMLIDTYYDEKTEAIAAADTLKERLDAVRLDTPSSRKGNFKEIIREVRWELDIRGYGDVGIFVSGGMDEEDIYELRDLVDGFGVGSCVAGAKPIDLALDIVEMDGIPCAKRGKYGGKKQVYRGWEEMEDKIVLSPQKEEMKGDSLLKPIIKDGKILREFPMKEARELLLKELDLL